MQTSKISNSYTASSTYISPEQKMWKAALVLQGEDALGPYNPLKTVEENEAIAHKHIKEFLAGGKRRTNAATTPTYYYTPDRLALEARSFLRGSSMGLRMMCECAGHEWTSIRAEAIKKIAAYEALEKKLRAMYHIDIQLRITEIYRLKDAERRQKEEEAREAERLKAASKKPVKKKRAVKCKTR